MGYFTIYLPHNIQGDVRWGNISKLDKPLFKLLTPWKKVNREHKTGYIIKLKSAFVNETEYRLYRSQEGHWSQDVRGKVEVHEPFTLSIQKAIEAHEKAYK